MVVIPSGGAEFKVELRGCGRGRIARGWGIVIDGTSRITVSMHVLTLIIVDIGRR